MKPKPRPPLLRRLVVPAQTARLAQVRRAVLAAASRSALTPRQARLFVLAVDEALTNIIRHGGHPRKPPAAVRLRIKASSARLEVRISDRGKPFDPRGAPEVKLRRHLRKGKRSGLGIHLMRRILDEIHYERRSGGRNELTLIKHIDRQRAKDRP